MRTIRLLRNVYNDSPENTYGEKLSRALQDFCYPNGALNVLQAVYVLKAVKALVELGQTNNNEYNQILNRAAIITGYSKHELLERVAI